MLETVYQAAFVRLNVISADSLQLTLALAHTGYDVPDSNLSWRAILSSKYICPPAPMPTLHIMIPSHSQHRQRVQQQLQV